MSVMFDKYNDDVYEREVTRWKMCFWRPHGPLQVSLLNGRTKQEFAAECDINNLMRRYEKTGVLPPPRGQPRYVEAFDLPSYQEALETLSEADRAFMALPARIRGEFDNDPSKFVEFASDAENIDKLRSWGLAKPLEPAPEPIEVRVVSAEGGQGGA